MEEEKKEIKTKAKSKTVLTVIITIVITLFILFLLAFIWLLVSNPFNIRGIALYKLGWTNELVQIVPVDKTELVSDLPAVAIPIAPLPMTDAQKSAVEDFGIDPNSLVITPAMETCFVEKIGQERVDAIKGGATPGALELLKSSSCL